MMKLTVLDNGLRVVSRTMPGLETASVGLFADSGSRHEPARLNGIAHLFEHMVFKGAGGRSAREISEAIEDVGGDLNACTERDTTSFTAAVMGEHVPLALELIADMMLRPHFGEDDLGREKEVVLQELAEASETPSDLIFDELWAAAFAEQPLGRSILGDEASISRIGTGDLRQWQSERYRAGSLILAAAGKVDHDALARLAEGRFGALPTGDAPKAEAAGFTGTARVARLRSEQAHISFAHEAPAALAPDYFAARLFADIAGGGASSRLFQSVREERGLAYSVSAHAYPYLDTGIFSVHAATSRRQSAAASALMDEVLAATAADATQRELDRARTQARAGLLMHLESPWGQAAYAARQLSLHGRLVEPAEIVEQLLAVSLDDVRNAGTKMLGSPRATATIAVPAARAA